MVDCVLCNVVLKVTDPDGVKFHVEEEQDVMLVMGEAFIQSGIFPDYDGPCEVTPGPETQILQTMNTSVRADIIVGPIPQNYGLISYNGGVITVS